MTTDAPSAAIDLHRPLQRSTFELSTTAWLPQSVDEVFPFFGDAHNLDILTPPWLSFEILTPRPIPMHAGTLIDYRIKLRGIPMRWRTRISLWEPNRRFVDEQLRGPYLEWIHTHTFEPLDGGTLMKDTVRYRVPGGGLVNRFFVQRDVERIFTYRLEALRGHFGCLPSARDIGVAVRRLR
ncbi:SRPBCC family protein [Luteitalea sp.]|jgi:ligand-binding SRPBCC domain-containing protein|uniref:SRPBCC family protein n=1 Tax=Luteitalea sp. TaxID=2004800 RepID=UPI0037CC84B0